MNNPKYKISPKPTADQIATEKKKIVKRFYQFAIGRILKQQSSHDGKAGHNAEAIMGLRHNNSSSPDFGLIELKTETGGSKITFGDWSPDYKIWKSQSHGIGRDEFMKIFGKYNEEDSRWSWSGVPVPKINLHNAYGQTLKVEIDLSIAIHYSYSKDQRPDKGNVVPPNLQKEDLILARWSSSRLRSLVENKFNLGGWCKLRADKNGVCREIVFGRPFTYEEWIGWVKNGSVFFDSGMHQGNPRPYAHWRADNSHWDSLVTESYDHRHESEFLHSGSRNQDAEVSLGLPPREEKISTGSSDITIGKMSELLDHPENSKEAYLSAFGKIIMERVPSSVWGNMREDEIKASIHVALAGYRYRNIELGAFPFRGSREEKEQWVNSIPAASMFRGQCKPYGLHASSESVARVSKILEVEAVRDGSIGGRRETASVVISLEGKPWEFALDQLAKSIGCHDSSTLEQALILFEIAAENQFPKVFCVQTSDQMERLLGALTFVVGPGYERLIPSSDLISAVAGTHHPQSLALRTTSAVINCPELDNLGEAISKNDILAATPVILGVGNVCEPYPVGGTENDRSMWRERIKTDPRTELVSSWTSVEGRTFTSVSKTAVLATAHVLDQLWQSGDSSVKRALEPYSIATQAQISPLTSSSSPLGPRRILRPSPPPSIVTPSPSAHLPVLTP